MERRGKWCRSEGFRKRLVKSGLNGGAEGDRTPDLMTASQVTRFYQAAKTPKNQRF